MKDDKRTKEELFKEIESLEEKVKMFEAMQPEYKTAEKSLRESEEKYRLLFEGETDAVMISDAETKQFEDANAATLKLLGYSKEEFLSLVVLDISHEKDKTKASVDDIVAGKPESMRVPIRYMEKKDGTVFPVEISAGSFTSDGRKKIIGAVRDITGRIKAEEEVRRERDRAQQYLDIARVTILALDAEGKVTLINKKGCEVTGYEYDEIMGKNWLEELVPERIRGEVKDIFFAMMRSETDGAEMYDNPIVTKSGEERIISWRNTIITDEEGRRAGTLSSGEDITDQKRAEDVLRDSEEKFKTIFDNAMDGILVADVEAKMFLAANKSMCRMMGYTEEELKKKGIANIHRKEDLPCVQAAVQKQLSGEESLAKDIPMLRKDGSVFCADVNSVPVTLGGRACLMGIFHDTTERKHAEDVLRESEEKFRSLVERANDGICIIQDGVFRYVNDRMAAMCGLTEDEMTGNAFKSYLHSSEAEKVYDRYKKRMAGEDVPAQYETKFAHRDGHEVFVEVNAGMAPYKGKPADFVIVHDITERKKTEIEKQKQRDLMDKTNKDLRWKIEELEAAFSHIKVLEGLIPICVNCKKIHLEETDPKDPAAWVSLEKYISEKTDASLTHGLCPDCVKKMYDEIKREKNEE